MSTAIVSLFEHNMWANTQLFDFCASISGNTLDASAIGCFGTIREMLLHIVNSEADYYAILSKTKIEELKPDPDRPMSVQEIADFYSKFGEGMIHCAREISGELILEGTFDDGLWYRMPASGIFLQALNHATEHRVQIATTLTQQGIEPPRLDGWIFVDTVMMPEGAWER